MKVKRASGAGNYMIDDLGAEVVDGSTRDLLETFEPWQIDESSSLHDAISAGELVAVDANGNDIPVEQAFNDVQVLVRDLRDLIKTLVQGQYMDHAADCSSKLVELFGSKWGDLIVTFDTFPPDEMDEAASSNLSWDAETEELKQEDSTIPAVFETKKQKLMSRPRYCGACPMSSGGKVSSIEISMDGGEEWHEIEQGVITSTRGWRNTKILKVRITFDGGLLLRAFGVAVDKRLSYVWEV